MANVIINDRLIFALTERAFSRAAVEFNAALEKSITDSVYPWPRATRRRSGQVVSSPRNIVDTGRLLNSQSYSIQGTEAEWRWTAPYSIIVHEGATLRNGTEIPARRWTRRALREFNLSRQYADNLRQIL
jgi:hypothetical protein